MLTGVGFLGLGILLFIVGVFLYAGVIITQIPLLGWVAWIPMAIGGLFILIGIVLLVIRR